MAEIRKIESAEDSERKRKRNTLILSIIMILILVFSTAGYFTFRDEGGPESGEGVENIGDAWILRYGNQAIKLSNPPESSENVSILLFKTINDYYGQTVYVAYNNEANLYELASAIERYTERMQPACYGECEKNLPEKDCNETMIVIRSANESERGMIYEEDNCVFIEGGLREVDAFIYKIFGVI